MGKTKIIFVDTRDYGKDKTLALSVEKFYNMGEKVLILTDSQERGEQLDDLLWTFKQQSFIPHTYAEDVVQDEPVVITILERNLNGSDVLVLDVPASEDFISQFEWVVDFVDRSSDETLQESRRRFREYRKKFEVEYREKFV